MDEVRICTLHIFDIANKVGLVTTESSTDTYLWCKNCEVAKIDTKVPRVCAWATTGRLAISPSSPQVPYLAAPGHTHEEIHPCQALLGMYLHGTNSVFPIRYGKFMRHPHES